MHKTVLVLLVAFCFVYVALYRALPQTSSPPQAPSFPVPSDTTDDDASQTPEFFVKHLQELPLCLGLT